MEQKPKKKCKKPTGNPTGRPKGSHKYDSRFDHMAYVACYEGGFTVPKLAKLFSVVSATINSWMREFPSFLESINKGRDEYDSASAEESLKKRICGYEFKETTEEPTEIIQDGEPVMVMTKTKVVTKSIPPDPTSIIFFLKNRQPGRWRDKSEHELTIVGIDEEILAARRKRALEA